MRPLQIFWALCLALSLGAQTPKKILFNHTKHEDGGVSA